MDSPWELGELQLSLRLVLALVFGGLVGIEREQNNHPAGFRTHILVCLGACLIMLLSIYGFSQFADEPNVRLDPARLAAQVITGIGFLGAGTIIFNGNSISGLTTAASLWVVAAIGLATGAGFYYSAVLTTVFVLLSLWILNKVEKKWLGGKRARTVQIELPDSPGGLSSVTAILAEKGAEIRKLAVEQVHRPEAGEDRLRVNLVVRTSKPEMLIGAAEELRKLHGVSNISIE
ncbi:MgtC/SapB family protein [Paenibacillus ginsengarvi]|uniref:MgtC/SapB family protein n=1 Tax=Paenibacillus ginsengarvi TaxID=400777 RepID=A0A3B0BK44_9BACL|nr:MgtC/SapB family protein [Paenibacillus ginsengarvi]RKN71836.1 MgtC/SapB family protein [Paenibacillus ginsengarvi]